MKVFWSWQSDTPAKLNKEFVKAALQEALSRVSDELGFSEADRPEVDHDTKDAPGFVEIVRTIFEKIEQAEVFVADVTFVGKTADDKLLPNANVMIELGHALTSVGHEGIILVQNTAFGGKPEDLPFDLRHRRGPITYSIKPGVSPEQREGAFAKLTEALVEALKLNLGAALEKRISGTVFSLHPAREGDRSIWLQPGEPLRHQDTMFATGQREWTIPEAPRSYLRIAPAGWASKPARKAVLDGSQYLFALGPWVNGNYGANELGVVKVGFGRGNTNEAIGAMQWFNKTGEIWGFNCAATYQRENGRKVLCLDSIAREWGRLLMDALAFLERFGARGPIRVEAGVTGLKDVYWPDEMWGACQALETEAWVEDVHQVWTEEKQRALLADAYNQLHDAFSKARVAIDQVPRPA